MYICIGVWLRIYINRLIKMFLDDTMTIECAMWSHIYKRGSMILKNKNDLNPIKFTQLTRKRII